ncbi:uncharacterized protein L201_000942 [Kwoniella dendrophila CBS 6074]|uniref:Uncharacterized protein n=1 Tax=Kwoniella dendrophila CBS 6074 TaxID=1295534 RepID=A0AAX4JKY3_9TREE
MKRSSSPSTSSEISSSSTSEYKQECSKPSSPPDKKPKIEKETPSPKKTKSTSTSTNSIPKTNANGVWDGDKRSLFIDEVLSIGYKNANLDEIASKLGMNKRQLVDQLVPNRKTNLRGKIAVLVKEF